MVGQSRRAAQVHPAAAHGPAASRASRLQQPTPTAVLAALHKSPAAAARAKHVSRIVPPAATTLRASHYSSAQSLARDPPSRQTTSTNADLNDTTSAGQSGSATGSRMRVSATTAIPAALHDDSLRIANTPATHVAPAAEHVHRDDETLSTLQHQPFVSAPTGSGFSALVDVPPAIGNKTLPIRTRFAPTPTQTLPVATLNSTIVGGEENNVNGNATTLQQAKPPPPPAAAVAATTTTSNLTVDELSSLLKGKFTEDHLAELFQSKTRSEVELANTRNADLQRKLREALRERDEIDARCKTMASTTEKLKEEIDQRTLELRDAQRNAEYERKMITLDLNNARSEHQRAINALTLECKTLESTKNALEHSLNANREELGALQKRSAEQTTKLNALLAECDVLRNSKRDLELSLQTSRDEGSALRKTAADQSALIAKLELQQSTLSDMIKEKDDKISQQVSEIEYGVKEADALRRHVLELESKLRQEETTRRRLHNTIQELKGNIRVFCRVRPMLKTEVSQFEEECKSKNVSVPRVALGLEQREAIEKRPFSRLFDDNGKPVYGSLEEGARAIQCAVEQETVSKKLESIETPIFPNHIKFPDGEENAIIIEKEQLSTDRMRTLMKEFPFHFDRVYDPMASQNYVFRDLEQLVQSALDGYNVCIFAYGQTGSGKTYTMEGLSHAQMMNEKSRLDVEAMDLEDEETFNETHMGMIPRAVRKIFMTAKDLEKKGWTYKFEAQYLEIYNETIRDLLQTQNSSKKHEIKHNLQSGKTIVTDTVTVQLENDESVHDLLRRAAKSRAVASTNSNEHSSRSHSVFIFRLIGDNSITEEHSEGILNLIDLAGSERLHASRSTGDRLKETQAINKSLSCLGDVINALANKEAHVPYRNSKLTYLLQNSLGGNSKTLMFVNISPMPANFQESLCSLRFATKVNSCEIGTAKRTLK